MNDWRDCQTMLRHLGEFDIPEDDRWVLCWVDGGYTVGKFDEGEWYTELGERIVYYWRELPEPPAGERKP